MQQIIHVPSESETPKGLTKTSTSGSPTSGPKRFRVGVLTKRPLGITLTVLYGKFYCWSLCRYGYHRWAVAFSRHEKTVGIYLVWRSASEGMKVTLDFNLILLNREHFSQNQTFNRKRVKFSHESPGNET